MLSEELRQHREALAYIKDVKGMILADARALYAVRGLTHRAITFDVITSTYGGAYQATLIYFRDLDDSKVWHPLYEGCKHKDLCTAMKMLWDGMQTGLGDAKAMSQAVLLSPVTMHSAGLEMSPPASEPKSRTVSAEMVKSVEVMDAMVTEKT